MPIAVYALSRVQIARKIVSLLLLLLLLLFKHRLSESYLPALRCVRFYGFPDTGYYELCQCQSLRIGERRRLSFRPMKKFREAQHLLFVKRPENARSTIIYVCMYAYAADKSNPRGELHELIWKPRGRTIKERNVGCLGGGATKKRMKIASGL